MQNCALNTQVNEYAALRLGMGAGWTLGAFVLAATWEQYELDAPNPKNMNFLKRKNENQALKTQVKNSAALRLGIARKSLRPHSPRNKTGGKNKYRELKILS